MFTSMVMGLRPLSRTVKTVTTPPHSVSALLNQAQGRFPTDESGKRKFNRTTVLKSTTESNNVTSTTTGTPEESINDLQTSASEYVPVSI